MHTVSGVAIVIDLCMWFDPERMKGLLLKFMMSHAGITLKGHGAVDEMV